MKSRAYTQIRPADWVAAIEAAVVQDGIFVKSGVGVAICCKATGAECIDWPASRIFSRSFFGEPNQLCLFVQCVAAAVRC